MIMTVCLYSLAVGAEDAAREDRATLVRLTNGFTVLVKEDARFPLVSLRLYVRAGSTYETPEEAGISHMLEHMVFKGTENRPRGQIASDVEATGGYLNAFTSFDYTCYLTDMLSEHWKTGVDVLKDMAFHPLLDPAELESEKEVVVAELKRGEDNPGQCLFRVMQRSALKGTPYYSPIIGYENTVRGLSREAILAYISRLYQPQSMLLVVCGDIKTDEVLAEAKRLFGGMGNTQSVVPPARIDLSVPRGFVSTVEYGPWNKASIAVALPVQNMGDVRSAQLDVLAQILGGDASSRFYRGFQYEKHLVDNISVSNLSFERLGVLYITATLDADKVAPFWEAFSRELAALGSATFSEEELDRAKLNIEDDLFRSKETIAGQADKLGHFAFFDKGEQGEINYLRTVQGTDQRTLLQLIKENFSPEALSLVVLLPEGTPPAVKPAGGTEAQTAGEKDSLPAWNAWFGKVLADTWKETSPERERSAKAAQSGMEREVIDLGQGRTLVLLPDDTLPHTAMTMIYTGGDALLTEKNQGLGAFTASLLRKGPKDMSATAVEDFLSDRAADMSIASGRQTFSVNINAPSRFLPDMFSLLRDTLATPAFLDEEADRVGRNQLSAITMTEDQPVSLAFRRMFPFFFPHHPYGFLQLGEKGVVAAFKAANATAFWREQARQPWVLAVCGDYDREAVIDAAKNLSAPDRKEHSPPPPVWSKDRELDLNLPGRAQAHLFLVFPTVGMGHEDEPGLDLLQNILAGQSGLLFRELRDQQGLGYTVTAFPWKTRDTGALIFYIGTDPDKLEQAGEGFRQVISSLQAENLPDAELERGKNQMRGDLSRSRQALNARSLEAASLTALHLPLDSAEILMNKAREVDAETLRALCRKYLHMDSAYRVRVLP